MRTSGRVAVIGGGPAGLAAAHRLLALGASPAVLEARDWVGGRVRTDAVDGFRVDAAAQLLGSTFTEALAVARATGSAPLLVKSPGRDALWKDGRKHEVVYGSPASMLASGAVPLMTKLKLGATYLPYLHRYAGALDLHAPERAAVEGLDLESIAAWGRREMGRDFVELLAYPLLATLYGALPEETSAGFYHMLSRQGMNMEVFAVRGGIAGFCEHLAEAVRRGGGEVRTGADVRALDVGAEGVRLRGDGWDETFDAVIPAVPAPLARGLVASSSPALAQWLAGVAVRPTVTLALLLERPVGAHFFGLLVPRSESRVVASVSVQEAKGPGLVPDGRGLLVVFPTPEAGERLLDADARTIADTLLPDVERAFPAARGAVSRARVYRWPHAWTVVRPGYLEQLLHFRTGEAEGAGRIALAGDYLYAPTVEGAVASGIRAAERVVGRLG